MSAHVHIKLPFGVKFTEFCPQNDKSTRFNIILLFNSQYLTLVLPAMHTVPNTTGFLGHKTSTLKEYLSLLPLPWQPTTAQLNPPHIFIFSYIEKVSIQSIFFYPVLTCISMETGRSCQARWRIAAAAHNLCVLIGQITCQSSSLRTVNSWVSVTWLWWRAKAGRFQMEGRK